MPRTHDRLDHQTRALLDQFGDDSAPNLDELREPWPPDDPALLAPRELPAVADLIVPADPPVAVRIYQPWTTAPRAGLVWLHPGGFVAGAVEDIDGVCRTLAADGGCAVVSVAYRLAPEHPFPAALDDVTAVLRWLRHHATTLAIDPVRLAIGGQSAGATLAAATVLRLRDANEPLPLLQILAYPVLDPTLDAPSYTENGDGFGFATSRAAWCWERYLGGAEPTPLAAPLLAPGLHGLPPALILAAGHDPARDDSRRYARRLAQAGVAAELVEYESTIHAFLSFAGVLDVAQEALALVARRLHADLAAAEPRLHHVALPYPPGRDGEARAFYQELLGLPEKPAPSAFAGRGFVWFAAGPGEAELHLIPEPERHACLATDRLGTAVERLRGAGHPVERYDILPDRPQAFVRDPFGNLLELTSLRGPRA